MAGYTEIIPAFWDNPEDDADEEVASEHVLIAGDDGNPACIIICSEEILFTPTTKRNTWKTASIYREKRIELKWNLRLRNFDTSGTADAAFVVRDDVDENVLSLSFSLKSSASSSSSHSKLREIESNAYEK